MTDQRNEPAEESPRWHAMAADEAIDHWRSSTDGLTDGDVRDRLARYGPNRLPAARRRGMWARLLTQFNNVLIYVLLGAAIVTTALAHWTDTIVIVAVVLINALIGFVQEGKAERAMEAIRNMLSPHATVLRGGVRLSVDAADIVPGDVVVLQPGDRVPADVRLFRVKNLRIEEAALTGESVPVEKAVDPVDASAVLGDRRCVAFSGTLVTYGTGAGVVVATGSHTELGRISGMMASVQTLTTKLLQKIATFGKVLTGAILAVASLTFAYGVWVTGRSVDDMFLMVVGLAVAAIPEGLPAIITITLAIGVQRMAKRQAIIRRLPAVETLGSVTVICSDKTGTLTRNEMTVRSIVTGDRQFDVGGAGYRPVGRFVLGAREIDPQTDPALIELLHAGLHCNEASLVEHGASWGIEGDPTEGALVCVAAKAGLDPGSARRRTPPIDSVPFESEHKYMATLHAHSDAGRVIYLKGAPERVLDMCMTERHGSGTRPVRRAHWEDAFEKLARRGERVLALACREVESERSSIGHEDVAGSMTMLGVMGIVDPPRPEAVSAVDACRSAGIQVKMITGDHAVTARAVGAAMGIGDGTAAITGEAIESASSEDLARMAGEVDVFARVSPEHKLRLVEALQAAGNIVAMTGDGVNDAPALKRADVGVAMGLKGTEVAKEAAEMVLADDNFASIAHAVEEGRTVYDNIRKAILFILPTNAAEAGTIIVAVLLGRMLPITPLQILWVNMVTAVTLALALAFEPAEEDVMLRPPRAPGEPILTPFLIWRIAFVGALMVLFTFALFLWERTHGASIEVARSVAVNTLVMFEIVYVINCRFLQAHSIGIRGFLGNGVAVAAMAIVVALQLAFTYGAPMQRLFETDALGVYAWGRIIVAASVVFWIVEAEKALLRRGRARAAAGAV